MVKYSLGRGLQSLIPSKEDKKKFDNDDEKQIDKESIYYIEIEKIKPNPHQPRKDLDEASLGDLAKSIKRYGILQPLIVSKIESDTAKGRIVEYQLIAGERRLRAAQAAGFTQVPVVIREDVQKYENKKLEMALVENLQRKDLNPIEQAEAYKTLADDFGLSHREIGEKIGRSREVISNTIRLLDLPDEIKQALREGKIGPTHAKVLLSVSDEKARSDLFKSILEEGLRTAEVMIKARELMPLERMRARTRILQKIAPEMKVIEQRIQEVLGAKVLVQPKNYFAGKIIIEYFDREGLDSILEKIVGA